MLGVGVQGCPLKCAFLLQTRQPWPGTAYWHPWCSTPCDLLTLVSMVHPQAPVMLRLVFHDAATYDAAAGDGGADASVAFELDRAENFGLKCEPWPSSVVHTWGLTAQGQA